MMTELLAGLNPQQQEAVTTGDGPVLVLAGPGSGKTRVLTHRVAYLIREVGVYPGSVMAVTFTNKAANEMRSRVESLLESRLTGVQLGTFHAICARLLRRESQHTPYTADFLIYDRDDQLAVIKQAMAEAEVNSSKMRPGRVLGAISAAKNELITPEKFSAPTYFGEVVKRVYPRYQEILVANNALDFDDLLMQMVFLLQNNDEVRERYQRYYEYLLVDEFQDTNMAQYQLVLLLSKPQNNVFAVGDEDQGIYAFRGADYRNVMHFRRDFPDAKVILLEQNYRSTQVVLDVARAVISKNTQRTPKALFTERGGGVRVTLYEAYDEREEGTFIVERIEDLRREHGYDYKDFAVMYRTNAQSRAIEDACVAMNLPYRLVGGVGFYKRREIKDLLAYLRLINNANDTVSFTRIVNVPKRGIGKKSIADFRKWVAKNNFTQELALSVIAEGGEFPLSGKAARSMTEFTKNIFAWRKQADDGDLTLLLDDIVARTGFNLYLHDISDSENQTIERSENVRELRGLLKEYEGETLGEFLAEIALVADVDEIDDNDDKVTLLTLHSAKGLEFPVVFISGVEDGLLPHIRSFDDSEGMAEERRLMYVGVTRAMDELYLSYTFRRAMYNATGGPNEPSRFLEDIPAHLTKDIPPMLAQKQNQRAFADEISWETDWDAPRLGQRMRDDAHAATPKPEPKPTLFKSNQRVYHGIFGEGIVIESKRVDDDDEEVVVSFAEGGIKRLMASFAKLTILDG